MIKIISLIPIIILLGCNASINESFRLEDGGIKEGDVLCINGSIIIGNDCKVLGDCKAINGSIKIGKNSTVESIQSVNGPVFIDSNCNINGSITAVNGGVQTNSSVNIAGDVSSINGNITLENTKVSENVETENGDIILTAGSIVEKDIRIKGKSKWSDEKRYIEVRLEQGAQVLGNIEVDNEKISVQVYLSNDSKILGDVINAEIVYE